MDGIERIAARIREDAEQEIARMNQEATEQVEAIQAQAQAQASREREEILARGRRAAEICSADAAAHAGAGRTAGGACRSL